MCAYDDGHTWCFSCNKYTPKDKKDDLEDFTYEYLPWRGVSKESFQFFDCKTKIDKAGKPVSLGFRYGSDGYKVRLLDRKEFYIKGKLNGLFGQDKFQPGSHKYVTIVEGELDAVSLWQVLKTPVVSVQSASSARRDCSNPQTRSWLNSYEKIYICFDADAAGRSAAAAVAGLFDRRKIYLVKLGRKDSNDYLQHLEGDELRNIWWNSKRYQPETIISSFSDFEKILKEPPKQGVPYPFPTLNSMTYGMRKGESVLLTAMEGVGKTEMMHAIEYQLLKETKDNVGAIFLEESKQRHLQALASIHLRTPVYLPEYSGTVDKTVSALKEAVQTDDRLYLYDHFGSDDPDGILDTIRFLVSSCGCGWILLDHYSMVLSGLAGEDERKQLDYLSTQLEMMVVELDFGLIAVSHVNDEGQTRGSRNISKVCNVRIDLHRDVLDPDPVNRNTTYLTVSKNRFGMRTGPAGSLLWTPATYSYTEVANDNVPDRLEQDEQRAAA